MMSTITFNLKREYFDEIKSGEKITEFRAWDSTHWKARLFDRKYDFVEICLGYPKKDDMTKRMLFKWNGCRITVIKHKHFNNGEPTKVFGVRLTERIK